MAPIPALWASTLMSDNNVVIVGDFKQLPPIVLSDSKMAKKWIGSDIFELSGVKVKYQKGYSPEYFCILDEQYRMEPAIAEIANHFSYDGNLKSPITSNRKQQKLEFDTWYDDGLGTESPIVLLDTGSLNAWVTSVSRGSQTSRLNFLSAVLSVNLAERIISNYRTDEANNNTKVLIISPYRPHTKLVDLLIKNSLKLDEVVRAGTVHSFQGSEADVVIFDLVADEPHFKVNLFMHSPEIKEQMKRLFNVCITRAKFKLLIIGDFKYCISKGKNSELADLLRYLMPKFPIINAKEVAPKSLYKKTMSAQQLTVGGPIDTTTESFVVTQESFYKYLLNDLKSARYEITIYSPFITKDRLAFLLPHLQAAIEEGVVVFIITKSLLDRNKNEVDSYREIEEHLSKIGAIVIHKMRMHEKLVFIDDDIVWTGSLNPLSFSNTQEIMERRKNITIQKDYKSLLMFSELIEFVGKPESKCPICGLEMIAAEGNDNPYYWRCVTANCFTRSIDQKYPMNGELTCTSCSSPVEFGYWGEKPCWRCTNNKHHHQKLYRSHLKLPKMEKKISKKEMKKVQNYLDSTYPEKLAHGKKKNSKLYEQSSMF
jgi:hypothetical protein